MKLELSQVSCLMKCPYFSVSLREVPLYTISVCCFIQLGSAMFT